MTVRELIEKLEEYPASMRICKECEDVLLDEPSEIDAKDLSVSEGFYWKSDGTLAKGRFLKIGNA